MARRGLEVLHVAAAAEIMASIGIALGYAALLIPGVLLRVPEPAGDTARTHARSMRGAGRRHGLPRLPTMSIFGPLVATRAGAGAGYPKRRLVEPLAQLGDVLYRVAIRSHVRRAIGI